MMLETALCNLKTALEATEYFHKLYVLAEKIQDGDKTVPKFYSSNGQVENLHNFDVNGSGYVRMRSQANLNPTEGTQVTSCDQDDYVTLSYPLRGVFAVPKVKLNDSAFSAHTLALDLIAAINLEDTAVTNASSVGFTVTSYQTDINQIWKEEVSGVDYQMNLKLAYVALDFTLAIETNINCINQVCY